MILGAQTVGIRSLKMGAMGVNPILAFHVFLATMDVDGFISFICVEKKSPSPEEQNSWHIRWDRS